MGDRRKDGTRLVASHRRARHEYHVLDELECGIVLQGSEVKSLREGRCSLAEAWARIADGELWLVGMHVPEYRNATHEGHELARDRKLLAHRREIDKWGKAAREKGVTIVPLEIYFKDQRVKVRLALARGKKLFDKREREKERTAQREIDRALKR